MPQQTMTFENKEYGISAIVKAITSGFSVTLRDDEAGEYLPSAVIYKTEELAIAAAKKLVK